MNRVPRNTRDGADGVRDRLPVLDVEALDLGECAIVGAIVGDELGDDGERLAGVEDLALAEEGLVAHAPAVVYGVSFRTELSEEIKISY
jgi:hypothetical protein